MRALNKLKGKQIFAIVTTPKGTRNYSGECVEITDLGNNIFLVGMTDKFGKFVAFNSNDIDLIEEEFKTYNDRNKERCKRGEDDAQ